MVINAKEQGIIKTMINSQMSSAKSIYIQAKQEQKDTKNQDLTGMMIHDPSTNRLVSKSVNRKEKSFYTNKPTIQARKSPQRQNLLEKTPFVVKRD